LVMTKTLMVTSKVSENWQKSLEKYIKNDRKKSVLLSAHAKRVVVSHMPEVQKRHKNAPHQHTNNIHFFLFCYNLHT
jgi:hypothetical protein